MKKSYINVVLCLSVAVIISVISAAFLPVREENIYKSVIRLHVIANSDREVDQIVKLAVRDELLKEAEMLFDCNDIESAAVIARDNLDALKNTADKVLAEKGMDYESSVTLDVEDFPTRDYGDAVFPGGKYLSLCVRLGDANGKNWWCVMFPPMCNGGAKCVNELEKCGETAAFTKNNNKPRFKFKLFLLELFN